MNKEDKIFELSLRRSLSLYGHILPETEEEIQNFDKLAKQNSIPPLPEVLQSLDWMINLEYNNNTFPTLMDVSDSNEMAMAAREGKLLPDDVLDKMKKDRDDARKGSD